MSDQLTPCSFTKEDVIAMPTGPGLLLCPCCGKHAGRHMSNAEIEADSAERKANAEADLAERKAKAEADSAERKAKAEADVLKLKIQLKGARGKHYMISFNCGCYPCKKVRFLAV